MNYDEKRMGYAVKTIAEEAARYCRAYKEHFGSPIGDDGVLGGEMQDLLRSLRGLLNGPLGREDGGSLDRLILDIAEGADLLDKNGEI